MPQEDDRTKGSVDWVKAGVVLAGQLPVIGGGVAVILKEGLLEWVCAHPIQAVAIVLVYELLFFGLTLARKIWQALEPEVIRWSSQAQRSLIDGDAPATETHWSWLTERGASRRHRKQSRRDQARSFDQH